jgi:hypothetical protein
VIEEEKNTRNTTTEWSKRRTNGNGHKRRQKGSKNGKGNKRKDKGSKKDAKKAQMAKQLEDARNAEKEKMENILKEAKKEFTQIIETENKRVQQVAELENERIMKKRRANETLQSCPVCKNDIQAIIPYEPKPYMQMMCCNARHCRTCAPKSFKYMEDREGCFNCRDTCHDVSYWASNIQADDTRHWLLNDIGLHYLHGTEGLRKSKKIGLKLIKKAAELGNAKAQGNLAKLYYRGEIFKKCCLRKAICHAEKGADDGDRVSQSLLACMTMEKDQQPFEIRKTRSSLAQSLLAICMKAWHSPDYYRDEKGKRNEKVFKLHTLASCQGCPRSRFALASFYANMVDKFNEGEENWKKYTLLSLYWFGKAGEAEVVYVKDQMVGCKAMAFMAYHLTEAMRCIWHPLAHLPGYSHVPFLTWALAKGGQYSTDMNWPNPWISRCANCNKVHEEGSTQFNTCARCKAFYYCSRECQKEHWKAGHKVDCRGHWIEEFFPDLRMSMNSITLPYTY